MFQEGDFLVLPSSIKLDGAKLLIDEALGILPSNQTSHATSASSNTSQASSVLKLNTQKGKMLFSISNLLVFNTQSQSSD